MCTAITYHTRDHYFGRTLDIECGYGEQVVMMPRGFPLSFRKAGKPKQHYAMLGMAAVVQHCPLYFDAVNEWGLAMAGLNFPGQAVYFPVQEEKENIAPYELIPYILGQCKTVDEALERLEKTNIIDLPFSDNLPLTPLHWMIADRHLSVVVESVREGLKVHENPIGVMTNSPSFDYHLLHLSDYMQLSNQPPKMRFGCEGVRAYSRGMGAMGLPGDWSSASRFVRAAFVKEHGVSPDSELASVSQFFHMLGAVSVPRGCMQLEDGHYQVTSYTSCMNLDRRVYYYTTYENSRLSAVNMHRFKLDGTELKCFPLHKTVTVHWQN
ncbi:MAG: choloylglycine hydrolase [Clostridia bacterium]|nr:choloylglycine hydrolase [Clostridia bacterium]